MRVQRIDHIHIAVKDLDRATGFFERVLGDHFSRPIEIDGEDELGNRAAMRSVLSPLGLEVVAPIAEEGFVHRFLEKRGEGLHAICFKVDDLEAAIRHFEENGVRLVGRITQGKVKEAQFHPKDSCGFMIELCEYPDRSATYDACVDND
ncbi:MAG: VOC family protein [Chloroflexota bacterium]|nr:MAG: VOC family protein [Chloroflexota bacterium]